MTEYKTLKVAPNEEEFWVDSMGAFGWIFVSAQQFYGHSTEVLSADTKIDGSIDDNGNFSGDAETEFITRKNVTHFVSLRFYRDMRMPNYTKLKELGNDFYGYLNSMEREKYNEKVTDVFYWFLGLAMFWTIGIVLAYKRLSFSITTLIIIGSVALFDLILIIFAIARKKMKDGRVDRNRYRRRRMKEALEEAYELRRY